MKATLTMNDLFFYFLILLTAIFTIRTDIAERKIYNNHLYLIGIPALLFYTVLFLRPDPPVSANYFIINCALSLSIGFALFYSNLWRAGDAKLFLLYSLLIATKKQTPLVPFACIELFLNMFILALAWIFPSVVITVRKQGYSLSKKSLIRLLKPLSGSFMITLGLTWLLLPLLHSIKILPGTFIYSLTLFFSFRIIYRTLCIINNDKITYSLLAAGCIIRLILAPNTISLIQLLTNIKILIIFSIIGYFLKIFMEEEKEKEKRVPFAPFMFLGALLSYTGFLVYCINAFAKINR